MCVACGTPLLKKAGEARGKVLEEVAGLAKRMLEADGEGNRVNYYYERGRLGKALRRLGVTMEVPDEQ